MKKYTLETLIPLNHRFCNAHIMRTEDVEAANLLVEQVEARIGKKKPVVGDIIRYTNKYGEYYPNAHIEKFMEIEGKTHIEVCEQPYVPFVYTSADENDILYMNTSGGAWTHFSPDKLTYVGTSQKRFKFFGSCGACADGAVEFLADVNVWEYVDERNPYAPYTTKDWDRTFITFSYDPNGEVKLRDGYRYFGSKNGMSTIAFKTKDDYLAWLHTYKGVEFFRGSENNLVVFHYREENVLMEKENWDKLDLSEDTRMRNADIVPVKVWYDDKKHIVFCYRYTNGNTGLIDTHKPYELFGGKDKI